MLTYQSVKRFLNSNSSRPKTADDFYLMTVSPLKKLIIEVSGNIQPLLRIICILLVR